MSTHWSKVLEVHRFWLISKGYTERALDSAEPDGMFFHRLKDAITVAATNTLWTYRLEAFPVEIAGYFNNKMVNFQFNYTLDPAKQGLFLSSMKAILDDIAIDYPIFGNTRGELPPAPMVYKQLLTLASNIVLHRIAEAAGKKVEKGTGKRHLKRKL